jgi:hypothetical protein
MARDAGPPLRERLCGIHTRRTAHTAARSVSTQTTHYGSTKRVAELLAERITALRPDLAGAQALAVAAEVLQTATGSKLEPPKRSDHL